MGARQNEEAGQKHGTKNGTSSGSAAHAYTWHA